MTKEKIHQVKFYYLLNRALAIGTGQGIFPVNNILDLLLVSLDSPFVLYGQNKEEICSTNIAFIKHGYRFFHQSYSPRIFFLYMLPLSPDQNFLRENYSFQVSPTHPEVSWIDESIPTIVDVLNQIDKEHTSASKADALLDKLINPKNLISPAVSADKRVLNLVLRMLSDTQWIPDAKEASRELNISESRFLSLFGQEAGMTYTHFKKVCKHKAFNEAFAKTMQLTESSYAASYTDSAHFCNTFKNFHGLTPKQFYVTDSIEFFIQD